MRFGGAPPPTASLNVQASEWREGACAAAEPNTGSSAGVGHYSSVGNKVKGVIPGTWARPCLLSVFLAHMHFWIHGSASCCFAGSYHALRNVLV